MDSVAEQNIGEVDNRAENIWGITKWDKWGRQYLEGSQ